MLELFCSYFTLLLLTFQHVQGVSEERRELATMLHNTCQQQSGVSDEILARGMKNEFPDDPNLKCYIKCLMTESGVMDDAGEIDGEAIIAMLEDDIKDALTPAIRKCEGTRGADDCETAFLSHKCVYENAPDAYELI